MNGSGCFPFLCNTAKNLSVEPCRDIALGNRASPGVDCGSNFHRGLLRCVDRKIATRLIQRGSDAEHFLDLGEASLAEVGATLPGRRVFVQSLPKDAWRRLQPNNQTTFQAGAILGPEDDAPAGRNDAITQAAQFLNDARFSVAEAPLSLVGKDLPNRFASPFFKDRVGVEPAPAEFFSEQLCDRRLAGAAITNEKQERRSVHGAASPSSGGVAAGVASGSTICTGDSARRTTLAINSRGGSCPVKALNCKPAWRTNISTPVKT